MSQAPSISQTKDSVQFGRNNWTFDCDQMMTDSQVFDFCRDGCLVLLGVMPHEINQRSCDWLDDKIPVKPIFTPNKMTDAAMERIRGSYEPSTIFLEE